MGGTEIASRLEAFFGREDPGVLSRDEDFQSPRSNVVVIGCL
jgi:hypothetical protein